MTSEPADESGESVVHGESDERDSTPRATDERDSTPQSAAESVAEFTTVDWDRVEPDGRTVSWRAIVVVSLSAAVAFLAVAETLVGVSPPVGASVTGDLSAVQWLFAWSLTVVVPVAVAVVPETSERRRGVWQGVRRRRLALGGVAVLVLFGIGGLLGPVLVPPPQFSALDRAQPPVWGSVDRAFVSRCVGPVVDGQCRGSWEYPLGTTDRDGKSVLALLVRGLRTSLVVVLASTAIVVPTGVAAGSVAATVGGRVRAVVRYVAELFQTLPAILVYLLVFWLVVEGRLVLLVVTLGLVGWGSLTRTVDAELRQRREEGYVEAAVAGGLDDWAVLRRHLLPNLTPTVVTTLATQVPLFVVIEASVSFVAIPIDSPGTPLATLEDPSVVSLGQLIYRGLLSGGFPVARWVAGVPALALVAVVFAANVLGDGLAEALSPER